MAGEAGARMAYTLDEAAEVTGRSRAPILRALQSGQSGAVLIWETGVKMSFLQTHLGSLKGSHGLEQRGSRKVPGKPEHVLFSGANARKTIEIQRPDEAAPQGDRPTIELATKFNIKIKNINW